MEGGGGEGGVVGAEMTGRSRWRRQRSGGVVQRGGRGEEREGDGEKEVKKTPPSLPQFLPVSLHDRLFGVFSPSAAL